MFSLRKKTDDEVMEEKKKYERAYNRAGKELRELRKAADSDIRDLRRALGNLESQHRSALSDLRGWKRKHEEALTQATMMHSQEMENLRQEHFQREEALNRKYHGLEQHSNNEYRKLHFEWEQKYKLLDLSSQKQLQDTKDDYEDQIQVLMRQLLVPTDGNLGWADDKMKTNFRDLQRLIREVASPTHRQFSIPEDERLPAHLDPTGIVERGGAAGRRRYHFVLQRIIWDIIQEQFFSVPFGFGALGPDKGKATLMGVFFSWRELFDQNARSTLSGDSGPLLVFERGKLANKWRCATFKGIQSEISQAMAGPLIKLSVDNCKQAVDRITDILTEVSRRSGKGSILPSHFNERVNEIASAARDFGLQFGVHSAHLRLFSPQGGDHMVIGEECFHCADADNDAGESCVVDTVIVPSLQRIGDGWADDSTKNSITPCYIHPQSN